MLQFTVDDRCLKCECCNVPMLPEMLYCPRCGRRGYRAEAPMSIPVSDVLLSVFFASITVGIGGWASFLLLRDPFGGVRSPLLPWLVVAGGFNAYLFGVPLSVLLILWYTRVRRGEFLHTWLWREYWRFEALALIPVLLLILFHGVGAMREMFSL